MVQDQPPLDLREFRLETSKHGFAMEEMMPLQSAWPSSYLAWIIDRIRLPCSGLLAARSLCMATSLFPTPLGRIRPPLFNIRTRYRPCPGFSQIASVICHFVLHGPASLWRGGTFGGSGLREASQPGRQHLVKGLYHTDTHQNIVAFRWHKTKPAVA